MDLVSAGELDVHVEVLPAAAIGVPGPQDKPLFEVLRLLQEGAKYFRRSDGLLHCLNRGCLSSLLVLLGEFGDGGLDCGLLAGMALFDSGVVVGAEDDEWVQEVNFEEPGFTAIKLAWCYTS